MITVLTADGFNAWLKNLRDKRAYNRIIARLFRFEQGNFGDIKPIGDGVYEARLDCGAGYRLYYARLGEAVIIMLCGGDKSSQKRDIAKAKEIKKELQR